MSTVIGSLRVDLSLATAAFNKGINATSKKLASISRDFEKTGAKIRNAGANMSASMTVAVGAIGGLSIASTKALHQLDNLSRVAGLGAKEFKVISLATQDLGIEQEKLSDILKDVNDKFGDFAQTGAGPLADFFEQIGPKVGVTSDSFKGLSSSESLGLYIRSLEKANVSQQEMTFYLEALASDATALLPAFANGGAAIEQTREKVERLGLTLSNEAVKGAKEAQREFALISEVLKTNLQSALVGLIPAFKSIVESLTPLLNKLVSGVNFLSEKFQSLSPSVQDVIAKGALFAAVLGPVLVVTGALVVSLGSLVGAAAALLPPLAGVSVAASALYAAWQPLSQAVIFLKDNLYLLTPFLVKFSGVILPVLGAKIAAITAGTKVLAVSFGVKLVGAVKAATLGLKGFRAALVKTGIGAIIVGIGYLVQKFIELVEAAGGFGNAMKVLKALTVESFSKMGSYIGGFVDSVGSAYLGIKASAFEMFEDVTNKFSVFINNFISSHVGAYEAVKETFSQLPAVMKNVVAEAANFILSGIENMTNAALESAYNLYSEVASLFSKIPGFKIEVGEFNPLELDRLKVDPLNAAAEIQSAFESAFNQDYAGDMAKGLGDSASEIRKLQAEYDKASKAAYKLARQPYVALEGIREAQSMLAKNTKKNKDNLDETNDKTENLEEILNRLIPASVNLGDSLAGSASKGVASLDKITTKAKDLKKEMKGIFDGFADDVKNSGLKGAFENLFDDIKSKALSSIGSLLKTSFSSSGAGIGSVFGGLKNSLSSFTTGISNLFGGSGGLTGALGSLGGAISSALPIIGAVVAGFSLFKGFSSKNIIGNGVNIGVSDGQIAGGNFNRIEKRSWWGLSKKQYDEVAAFSDEQARGLQAQIAGVKASVKGVYEGLGLSVADGVLDAVNLAVQRIDTKGLSDEEVQAKIQDVFASYGDALSQSLGGLDLEVVASFAGAQAALRGIGKQFDIFADDGKTLSKALLETSSNAAQSLVEISGGLEALTQKTSVFYDLFFTDQEKLSKLQTTVGDTFAKLSLEIPKTKDGFKQLVLAQDLTTKSGREVYAALLNIAPQFDAIKKASNQFKQDQAKTLFDLLPDQDKISSMKDQLKTAFGEIGEDVPKTIGNFRSILSGFDDKSSDLFYKFRELLPVWESVQDAATKAADASKQASEEQQKAAEQSLNNWIDKLSQPLQLDSNRYSTQYEATLAAAQEQRYGDIASKSTSQDDYLRQILEQAKRQNQALEALMLTSQRTEIYRS